MGKAFLNSEDTRLRLHNTICMYKGEAVYVVCHPNAPQDHMVHVFQMDEFRKSDLVDYRSPDFNYSDLPLGYLNIGAQAFYASRTPDRRQRQGLTKDSIIFHPQRPDREWWQTKALGDCLAGRYPTIEVALERLESHDALSVAVHRHIALERTHGDRIQLLYRRRVIAQYNGERFVLSYSKDSSFLERILSKAGIPI